MAGPSVILRTEAAEAAIRALGARAGRAIARGINRTASTTKVSLSRTVSSDLRLKVGTVKELIGLRNATPSRLTASLTASAKRIPLIEFRAQGRYPSRGRGRGVTVQLPGSQGRYPRAFIAIMPSGHKGVFERRPGVRRLPIIEKKGPSIAHVVVKQMPAARAATTDLLAKNIAHEIAFEASKRRT
jgi:hypothetical protein